MNNNDFRFMRRGKQLSGLTSTETTLLEPIDKRGTGKERALLLLHGFASTPAVYRCLIPEIKHYDAIICPALKGHAESIEAFSLSKSKDWLATASNTCEVLVNEYKKVDVLGLSLGGLLACELSKQFALNHLFLLAPALKLQMSVHLMLKLTQLLKCMGFYHLRNNAGNLITNEHAELSYRKLPIATIIEMLTLAQNYQWVAPTCPVDLFLGVHDAVVASKEVVQLFSPLPNATIHWLKNSAHILPLDNDFREIVHCINKYKK
jgi:carboxylesterase